MAPARPRAVPGNATDAEKGMRAPDGANASAASGLELSVANQTGDRRPARPSPEKERELRRQSLRAHLEFMPLRWALNEQQEGTSGLQSPSLASATTNGSSFPPARVSPMRDERLLLATTTLWTIAEPMYAAAACVALLLLLLVRRGRVRRFAGAAVELLDLREGGLRADAGLAPSTPRKPGLMSRWYRRGLLTLGRWPRLERWTGREAKRKPSMDASPLAGTEAAGVGDSSGSAAGAHRDSSGTPRRPPPMAALEEWCPALLGSTSDPPSIATAEQRMVLAKALPARFGILDWSLIYSTDQHGCSMRTMLSRAERRGPSLLLVLDSGGALFGAFNSQPWRKSAHGYFGTGESFLVQVHPRFQVFRWSRRNSLFALVGADFIAMGGGGGFGLWLDASFEQGSSSACDTFDNPPLASSREFRCVKAELWGFM